MKLGFLVFKLNDINFNIRFKLFSVLLLATGSVVLCMYLVMSWSFDQGFLDYINKQEEQKYHQMSKELIKHWEENKSWSGFLDDFSIWDKLVSVHVDGASFGPSTRFRGGMGENRRNDRPSNNRPEGQRFPPPEFSRRPPPRGETDDRPMLLDRNKGVVVGRIDRVDELRLLSLIVDNEIVGYLGHFPQNKLSSELDLLFVEQQSKAFLFVAFLMVIICVLVVFPIAAHLVKPIKFLSKGTERLISGHYKTVIPVTTKDELGLLSKNFNSLANTLRENEKARQQWIADISHELRTPLAILKGEIESIQDGVREYSPQALESLHAEVEHLNHLINDLYELSMSDIGALNYQKTKVNPVDVLSLIIESFSSEFESKNISLSFDSTLNSNVVILADAARLKQLFSNLLKNSLRYTDAPGKLLVEVDSDRSGVVFNFQDSSPGVSKAEESRLFERLFRVESSRNRVTGGAGLGLSICKNIVSAHNGSIDAKASPLGGIWISVHLPVMTLKNLKKHQG
jgi:two-component system sensor histidine kinase BaeS